MGGNGKEVNSRLLRQPGLRNDTRYWCWERNTTFIELWKGKVLSSTQNFALLQMVWS